MEKARKSPPLGAAPSGSCGRRAPMQIDGTPTTSQAMRVKTLHEQFVAGAGVEPRVQQLDCIQRVCTALRSDCHSKTPSNYLIQHATGSGKSLTIAALAHQLTKLVDERGNRFRHVVIVADRKALEEQLGAVVCRYLDTHGDTAIERAESCSHLRELLSRAPDRAREQPCRVIVTTFQKALARGAEVVASKPAASKKRAAFIVRVMKKPSHFQRRTPYTLKRLK